MVPREGAPPLQPISRGTELRVVQVGVEFIPPNGQGITSLGESQGQWIFVQYDRAKGWVERRFVMPLASRGGRMQ